MKFTKEEAVRANSHVVTVFDRRKGWFNTDDAINYNEGRPMGYYWVELNKGWRDYGKFQAFYMTCSYVISTCSYFPHDPSNLIFSVYKVIKLCNVYINRFSVVANDDY